MLVLQFSACMDSINWLALTPIHLFKAVTSLNKMTSFSVMAVCDDDGMTLIDSFSCQKEFFIATSYSDQGLFPLKKLSQIAKLFLERSSKNYSQHFFKRQSSSVTRRDQPNLR